jgi:hypothetical protein
MPLDIDRRQHRTRGAGHHVRISGFELWQVAERGLIASSQGHFDAAEYPRQLEQGI